jgi:hypothetical protein
VLEPSNLCSAGLAGGSLLRQLRQHSISRRLSEIKGPQSLQNENTMGYLSRCSVILSS